MERCSPPCRWAADPRTPPPSVGPVARLIGGATRRLRRRPPPVLRTRWCPSRATARRPHLRSERACRGSGGGCGGNPPVAPARPLPFRPPRGPPAARVCAWRPTGRTGARTVAPPSGKGEREGRVCVLAGAPGVCARPRRLRANPPSGGAVSGGWWWWYPGPTSWPPRRSRSGQPLAGHRASPSCPLWPTRGLPADGAWPGEGGDEGEASAPGEACAPTRVAAPARTHAGRRGARADEGWQSVTACRYTPPRRRGPGTRPRPATSTRV